MKTNRIKFEYFDFVTPGLAIVGSGIFALLGQPLPALGFAGAALSMIGAWFLIVVVWRGEEV